MTTTQLRKRWMSDEFVSSLTIPTDRMPAEAEAQDLDLRGIPKLANGEPLWHFRSATAIVQACLLRSSKVDRTLF